MGLGHHGRVHRAGGVRLYQDHSLSQRRRARQIMAALGSGRGTQPRSPRR